MCGWLVPTAFGAGSPPCGEFMWAQSMCGWLVPTVFGAGSPPRTRGGEFMWSTVFGAGSPSCTHGGEF